MASTLREAPRASFTDLPLSDQVHRAVADQGWETLTPIQALALPELLAREDVVGLAQTGSGKTAAFAIPLIEGLDRKARGVQALVLAPTRELAAQAAAEISNLSRYAPVRPVVLCGGVPIGPQIKALKNRSAAVVVGTPGRILDHLQRGTLRLGSVRYLVLDEADRMLDMGFQPQVDAIVKRLPRKRQTMFFSATLDGEVGELARSYTFNPSRYDAELPAHLESGETDHHFISVTPDNKVETLVELLRKERGLVLVFTRTKRGADRLVQKLKRHEIQAVAMHGDMSQNARERALSRFESGKVQTLIATDVAARGLDLDDITHVINFDPPSDDKGYTHRIGRTARAGRDGTGITLVLPEQQAEVSHVARKVGEGAQFEAQGMQMARPRLVYSGTRRSHKWGAKRPRRKI